MNREILETVIAIGIPDVHGDTFARSVFEDDRNDIGLLSPSVIVVRPEHDELCAPIAKVVRRITTVEERDGAEVGIIRQEIYWGHIHQAGANFICSFPEDRRPFNVNHIDVDISVDRANFNPADLQSFLDDVDDILPESTVGFTGRKAIEAEPILWLSASLAWLVFAKQIPFIGPAITEIEDAVIEELDLKRRVKQLIRSFSSNARQSSATVQASVLQGETEIALVIPVEGAETAIEEGTASLSDHIELIQRSTSVRFMWRDGQWELLYASLKCGDVLMSKQCFDRTMIQLTNAGTVVFPEQMEHIRFSAPFPIDSKSGTTVADYIAPAGHVIRKQHVRFLRAGGVYRFYNESGELVFEGTQRTGV